MTDCFARVFQALQLRRSLSLASIACLLSFGTNCLAQHHSRHTHGTGFGGVDHGGGMSYGNAVGGFQGNSPVIYGASGMINQFGGGGAYNNNGMYNGSGPYNGAYQYNYGGFNASAPLGGVSFGNGFGTASYSSRNLGVTTYGVSGGGFNYGGGYGCPGSWPTPLNNYSPFVFGNSTGVCSPNFFGGNAIANGYLGFLPFGANNDGGYSGWPYCSYASCFNPYFGAAGIAPTVLMLNVNLNMQQPVMQSAAGYMQIDPRLIDILTPAVDPHVLNPNGVEVPPIPHPSEIGNPALLPEAQQVPIPEDGVPVLNEFNVVSREPKISSLAEKIHSLRYQASGDDAFHKSDYTTADVFYATAIKTAPDRRAPYLRMAMVRIALMDFPNATRYLKAGLTMESDASRPWCTAEELYGQKAPERARSHGGPLWNWLAERPVSSDRLLLAGTFQKLRGYNKTADQMLAMASHAGPEAALVSDVMQLAANDIGPRAISDDLEQLVQQASTQQASADAKQDDPARKKAVEKSGGIFLRGGDVAVRTKVSATSPLSIPSRISADEAPPLFEIPLPEQN